MVFGGGTLGCIAGVHVHPSESVHVTVVAESVFLIDPSSEPPADRVKVAGHFQFYLDSTSSEPLLITASKSVDVPIPATASAGDHTLICRVHKHDGTPTEVTFEIDIKIVASVSTNTGADAGS